MKNFYHNHILQQRVTFYFILFISLLFLGCPSNSRKLSGYYLQIIKQQQLDSISSGSGLVLHRNKGFIISDNMNGVIEIDTANFSNRFYPFRVEAVSTIQSKEQKEDFECATLIQLNEQQHLLAFGSGSMRTTREKIALLEIDNPSTPEILDAHAFYDQLRKTLNIETEQLNLEGCFTSADSIYLLNRGTNQSIAVAITAFEEMLLSNFEKIPLLNVKQYILPKLDGFTASFSGACYLNNESFLFCASVEKVNNAIDDGEVAGSFIGIADFKGNVLQIKPLEDKGLMAKQKIESVEIKDKKSNGDLDIYAISDNDDGKSTWFLLRLVRDVVN